MNSLRTPPLLLVVAALLAATPGCASDSDTTGQVSSATATAPQASVSTSSPVRATAGSPAPTPATAPVVNYAGESANEAENFESYGELAKAADLVVLGQVEAIRQGPDEGSAEFPFATIRIDIRVTEVLRGIAPDAKAGVVEASFSLGQSYDRELLQPAFERALPSEDAIWVLRSLDGVYPGVYRLVTQGSIIEPAPDGSAQPAWYRGTAEAARTGRLAPGVAEQDQNTRLAVELSKLTFEQAIAEARQ